jgi:hypothetical protein
VVEEAEVVKPGNKRKLCSAAAAASLASMHACAQEPGRVHAPGPGPACACLCSSSIGPPAARVLQPERGFQHPWLQEKEGQMWYATCEEAGDKVSYLGLRADTLKRTGSPGRMAASCARSSSGGSSSSSSSRR